MAARIPSNTPWSTPSGLSGVFNRNGGSAAMSPTRRTPARLAEPPTVVRDDPVARVEQDRELLLPGRPAQGPTVRQHDGPARAVVLIVELDGPRVLLSDSDERHLRLLAVAAESPPT